MIVSIAATATAAATAAFFAAAVVIVALNPGPAFGPGGDGFMRLNIGCAREILREAMIRLKTAVDSHKS